MNPKTYFFVTVWLVAWCVFFPCIISRLNENDRQETARFQIRVLQDNGRIMQHTQESLDASRKLLERQDGQSKPSFHL